MRIVSGRGVAKTVTVCLVRFFKRTVAMEVGEGAVVVCCWFADQLSSRTAAGGLHLSSINACASLLLAPVRSTLSLFLLRLPATEWLRLQSKK